MDAVPVFNYRSKRKLVDNFKMELFESSVQRISDNEGFNIWGRKPKQFCNPDG